MSGILPERLAFNVSLAKEGIVSSANELHLDKENRLDCEVLGTGTDS